MLLRTSKLGTERFQTVLRLANRLPAWMDRMMDLIAHNLQYNYVQYSANYVQTWVNYVLVNVNKLKIDSTEKSLSFCDIIK